MEDLNDSDLDVRKIVGRSCKIETSGDAEFHGVIARVDLPAGQITLKSGKWNSLLIIL